MRRIQLLLALLVVICSTLPTTAREINKQSTTPQRLVSKPLHLSDTVRPQRMQSAAIDTFVLGSYSFDTNGLPDPQGWITVDGTYDEPVFHVDDFMGLPLPYAPLEGTQSAWAGIRVAVGEYCSYATLPGYGNSFNQMWRSRNFAALGEVLVTYKIRFDSEPGYDYGLVEYENKDDQWVTLPVNGGQGHFDGQGQLTETMVIPAAQLDGDVRIRFRATSDGAFSDQDGLWPTDGHMVIDSVVVEDAAGMIDFEDFEDEAVGALATTDGDWEGATFRPFGDFAALYPGVNLLQQDPCATNITNMWAFINGSTETYACGGHPEQIAVPMSMPGESFGTLYMDNQIWSPPMEWALDINNQPIPATATSTRLEFDVYRDLPLDNLVFYRWSVRSIFSGCAARWEDDNTVRYSESGKPDWFRESFDIGVELDPGLDQLQVRLWVQDACGFWCGVFGTGACHSHAPMFDNVRVIRVQTNGPEWSVRDRDMFQDSFAGDGTKTGTVRIDAAKDANETGGPFQPVDGAQVTVWESNAGLDFEQTGVPSSGPAIYCYVRDIAGKSGAAISDDLTRWPLIGSGGGWTVLRFDTFYTSMGTALEDRYWVDLNDGFYTPGDTIEYYFSARDLLGRTTYWSRSSGVTDDEAEARAIPNEMTCLPANGLAGTTDILYVDDYDGWGAQPFFDSAFDLLGLKPDRYDVLSPATTQGNGPASRVIDVVQQLSSCYKKIIWNSGDLRTGLIGDGSEEIDKSDDYGLLFDFLDLSPAGAGVYISGDNIAEEWVTLATASPVQLRNTYVNFNLIGGDHAALGEPLSPLVIAEIAGCFDHAGTQDSLIAYAECPPVDFDVLQPFGQASLEMSYSGNAAHGAVLSQTTANAAGDTARVLLSGFSYHHIRDDRVQFPVDRIDHLLDIVRWLGNDVPNPIGIPDVPQARLEQNVPNPFNPSTRIRYAIAQPGQVTLRIYNVAGQLVRTLVNDVQQPNPDGFEVVWDGRSDAGGNVSSGVYFYRIAAPGLSQTRKMVLLK